MQRVLIHLLPGLAGYAEATELLLRNHNVQHVAYGVSMGSSTLALENGTNAF
ncbi:hypothetical protein AA0116_g13467 [Alternaria tenuissima]|nr:hypothetical protein AA0116_g13467 [Alternaria tenuissima]